MTSTTITSEDPLRDMGPTGYENMENNKRSTVDEIRPGMAEEDRDLVSSLHETLRIVESMIENDPNPDLISQRNWSSIRISKDGGTLSTNFATNDEELQDPWSNDNPQESFDDNDHDLAELYEAVSEVMEDHNRLQNLQHQLHDFIVGIHPMYIFYHILLLLFEGAQEACQFNYDFGQAHFWWRAQQNLRDLWGKDRPEEMLDRLIRRSMDKKRDSIDMHVKSTRNYEVQAFSLERSAARYKDTLAVMEEQRKTLRLKMWYVCDVKNSAAYADALQVTRALRAMTEVGRSRQASGITSWARQRLRTSLSTDKAAAQALETLAAPKDYGGPTRLADQQAELTTRWLTKNSVENFCKGEERLHRFCHEVQKCANKLAGSNIQESPVLWSSNLFRHEKAIFDKHRNSATPGPLGDRNGRHNSWSGRIAQAPSSLISPTSAVGHFNDLSLYTPRPLHDFWKGPKPNPASLEYGLRPSLSSSNNPTSWFSMDPRTSSASNPVTTAVHNTRSTLFLQSPDVVDTSDTLKAFACRIKQTVTSLLLSDLGYILWNNGSETDLWINDADLNPTIDSPTVPRNVQPRLGDRVPDTSPSPARGDALSDSTITIHRYHEGENRSVEAPQSLNDKALDEAQLRARPRASELSDQRRPFRFSDAFSNILQRLSSNSDPYKKLDLLSELEMLVLTSLNDVRRTRKSAKTSERTSQTDLPRASPLMNSVGVGGVSKPRTKATSLEEVIANCTERRAATLTFTTATTSARDLAPLSTVFSPPEEQNIGTDEIVSTLLDIFRDDSLRPSTLYRDLQFIAAHIPPSILDRTAKGKAFWDAGLAALALKEERISAMITRATRITTYHISATKETDSSTFTSSYSADLVDTTLSHAAQLWTIAAKEGSPVAARELALFYLTHPELVARVTMPLSRVKEVFKTVSSQERGVDTGGLNPLTFAVVFHWMEVAANGGDKDARDFLRGTGDLSATR